MPNFEEDDAIDEELCLMDKSSTNYDESKKCLETLTNIMKEFEEGQIAQQRRDHEVLNAGK
ncbi:unnamed protein product [Dovyalis caffra]|uniref:Uncharacterized protein n=1 Tax=Dovyalis caffra TaxID=77055 RepID=A0AAV1RE61_9ROSI|nr:unnamed protein product [Dovyalis caffra]